MHLEREYSSAMSETRSRLGPPALPKRQKERANIEIRWRRERIVDERPNSLSFPAVLYLLDPFLSPPPLHSSSNFKGTSDRQTLIPASGGLSFFFFFFFFLRYERNLAFSHIAVPNLQLGGWDRVGGRAVEGNGQGKDGSETARQQGHTQTHRGILMVDSEWGTCA